MKKCKILLYIISSFFLHSNAFSQTGEWLPVAINKTGDTNFIKSHYVNKENGKIKIWVKNTSKDYSFRNKIYEKVIQKALLIVDCFEKQEAVLTVLVYLPNGELLTKVIVEDYEIKWHDIPPESIMEMRDNTICELFSVPKL